MKDGRCVYTPHSLRATTSADGPRPRAPRTTCQSEAIRWAGHIVSEFYTEGDTPPFGTGAANLIVDGQGANADEDTNGSQADPFCGA